MLDKIRNIYFLGIGGIGMSALARYFNAKGYQVAGYDRNESELVMELEREGIQIHTDDNTDFIAADYKNPNYTLVVYTPAIPEDMTEFVFFKKNGFTIMKRAQVLGEITRSQRGICISGTHGKTTTCTLTSHILNQSKVGCSAFLGGISKNFDKNILINSKNDLVVIEADEFDHSFLTLTPYMAVITSTDADHLDIYKTEEEYRKAFEDFSSLVRPGGTLIVKKGLPIKPRTKQNIRILTYSVDEGDFHAENIRIGNGEIVFDFIHPTGKICNIKLGVPVYINIENGIAAMALALLNGASYDEIRGAMASYKGVKRRFDIHLKTDKLTIIDDYAHHPMELKASIESIKRVYPDRKLTGIFMPHLYSRTRDLADSFAQSLSMLDEAILLPIYPAREEPIPGITSEWLASKVTAPIVKVLDKDSLAGYLKENKERINLVATLGAGDVDLLIPEITEALQ
ncbi:MAG: UDP-N-acetylmuramate--L-alanine ligase [Paludibacteraceae bacterium]|nr:UDP-N-acetylmuramate--L-alanine ligase [Paludibacteraceae bacterium]MBR6043316.1 UDP-N-acetylmuramate--L-alanine ligase [Paludibacteraceae bacterium]